MDRLDTCTSISPCLLLVVGLARPMCTVSCLAVIVDPDTAASLLPTPSSSSPPPSFAASAAGLFPLVHPSIAAVLMLDPQRSDPVDGGDDDHNPRKTATAQDEAEALAESDSTTQEAASPAATTPAVSDDNDNAKGRRLVFAAVRCDEIMMMMMQQQQQQQQQKQRGMTTKAAAAQVDVEAETRAPRPAAEASAAETKRGRFSFAVVARDDVDGDDNMMSDLLFRVLGRPGWCAGAAAPENVVGLLVATHWLESDVHAAVRTHQKPKQRGSATSSHLAGETRRLDERRNPAQAPILSRMLLELQDVVANVDQQDKGLVVTRQQIDDGGGSAVPGASVLCGTSLPDLLSVLLLPHHGGLNLRNLVWHGFVGSIGRPWLSLVLVLLRLLRHQHHHHAAEPAQPIPNDEAIRSSSASSKTNSKRTRAADASTASSSSSFERKVPVSSLLGQLPAAWRVRADLGTMLAVSAATTPAQEPKPQHDPDAAFPQEDLQQSRPPSWDVACGAIEAWMPTPQHVELWGVARAWIESSSSSSPHPAKLDEHRQIGATEGGAARQDHRPLGIICAVLVVLLEAGLRRAFCIANPQRKGRDDCARPGAYYVTLDGHGQRDRHELLLQPYLLETEPSGLDTCHAASSDTKLVKNQLLDRLGASRTSFLTDLFVSPYGPNLRAALSHGSWNARFGEDVRRLAAMQSPPSESDGDAAEGCGSAEDMGDDAAPTSAVQSDEEALESMEALLSAMYCCAIAGDQRDFFDEEHQRVVYLPQCSFTANVLASLVTIRQERGTIERILSEAQVLDSSGETLRSGFCFHIDATHTQQLEDMIQHLRPRSSDSAAWTLDLLYREYDTNRVLGPDVATRALVSDLADFMTRFRVLLETAAEDVPGDEMLSSRQSRSRLRLLACANDVNHFVSFACAVAQSNLERSFRLNSLQYLQSKEMDPATCHVRSNLDRLSDQEKVKLVERTRMVVSTVSTFITANTDRAFKAIEEYSRSKLVKKFITNDY